MTYEHKKVISSMSTMFYVLCELIMVWLDGIKKKKSINVWPPGFASKVEKTAFLSFLNDFDILILGGGLHFFDAILVHIFKLPRSIRKFWDLIWLYETDQNYKVAQKNREKLYFFVFFNFGPFFYPHAEVT